ncbi:SigE family RNA polymerase sigma factor [Phytohabitans sp. LJ34]|uniref:SigE family RNA polymerase sigma factor n=1 Tax=Phytohabitans sp. LJ34 TaxID=3452217 RepID=UPI003F89DDC6
MRGEEEREYVEFVTTRRPVLHRAAYLMCGDQHRADDIVQATMTALYRKWRRAREADNLDAYVHRMLVRAYLAEKRLGWARVRLMSEPPERVAASPPAGVEERDSLRTALARLPRAQRTVLVLRFACDMSVDDVAAALRTSPGNVKSHTSRGLAALRDLLDVQIHTPGRKDAVG